LCRHGAQKISKLKPVLDAHHIRMVAVGLEPLGLETFVANKYWEGELYLDNEKQSYRLLNLKRQGLLNSGFGLLDLKVVKKAKEADKAKVTGNYLGDGFQLGAVFIVSAGAKELLLDHRQKYYGDDPSPDTILAALNINAKEVESGIYKSLEQDAPECKEECHI